MLRSLSTRDGGSTLVEVLMVGSALFLVVMMAVAGSIEIALSGDELREAVRIAAVHSARHSGPPPTLLPAVDVSLETTGSEVRLTAVESLTVSYPGQPLQVSIDETVVIPIAPFRSRRG